MVMLAMAVCSVQGITPSVMNDCNAINVLFWGHGAQRERHIAGTRKRLILRNGIRRRTKIRKTILHFARAKIRGGARIAADGP